VTQVVHRHCIAHGRVQGVNYRQRIAGSARRHGVVGTPAKRADASVFIDPQGELAAVQAFLRDVRDPRGTSHEHAVERVAESAL
jgi:acylphosphatase